MDSLPGPLLELVIRFTQSISDVSLSVDSPRLITTLSLTQLIRAQLPATYASKRLRLIYAGKVLTDKESLFASLNLSTLRPPTQEHGYVGNGRTSAKGKQPATQPPAAPAVKLYIHCSIGDTLSQKELEDEATAAKASEEALKIPAGNESQTRGDSSGGGTRSAGPACATSTAPRGFDRLLATGFTAAEVVALRTQFLGVLSHTHTPDEMPTGAALLAMEDRWLDNDNNAGSGGDAAGDGDGETWGADDGRALDDFLWGNVVGFFWPMGAIVWGFREDGIWTRRRQIAVFTGLLINLTFGFARLTN